MSLEFVHREEEGIQIVDLKGQLTFGKDDLLFRGELDGMVKAGKRRVVLNLNDLSEMDTTGLGTLLYALARLRKAGGDLALVSLNPKHAALLMAARLATVFELFKTDQDAINRFFPGRKIHHYDILEFAQSSPQ